MNNDKTVGPMLMVLWATHASALKTTSDYAGTPSSPDRTNTSTTGSHLKHCRSRNPSVTAKCTHRCACAYWLTALAVADAGEAGLMLAQKTKANEATVIHM